MVHFIYTTVVIFIRYQSSPFVYIPVNKINQLIKLLLKS